MMMTTKKTMNRVRMKAMDSEHDSGDLFSGDVTLQVPAAQDAQILKWIIIYIHPNKQNNLHVEK